MTEDLFNGPDQSAIHHGAFGFLARDAAAMVLSLLGDAGLGALCLGGMSSWHAVRPEIRSRPARERH